MECNLSRTGAGVAIQADSPLLVGFVREGDIPSSLTQLLSMAMSPKCLPFPDC